MFEDKDARDFGPVGFESSWRSERPVAEGSCQTSSVHFEERGVQSIQSSEASTQTKGRLKTSHSPPAKFDSGTRLNDFGGFLETSVIESFILSPHSICPAGTSIPIYGQQISQTDP